jgi:hypothetical protein
VTSAKTLTCVFVLVKTLIAKTKNLNSIKIVNQFGIPKIQTDKMSSCIKIEYFLNCGLCLRPGLIFIFTSQLQIVNYYLS